MHTKKNKFTSVTGVPPLWQVVHKRMTNELVLLKSPLESFKQQPCLWVDKELVIQSHYWFQKWLAHLTDISFGYIKVKRFGVSNVFFIIINIITLQISSL